MDSETKRLAEVAAHSRYLDPCNRATTEYSLALIERQFRLEATSVLEMGPAEGVMTEAIAQRAKSLTVVEGSEAFARDLGKRFPGIEIVNCLFEDFLPTRRFDLIILGHVLEHVEDPVAILSRARRWLADGGHIFSAVPNARSIHRQAAVIMGLLEAEDAMSDLDRHHGHRRVFNPETYRHCFREAGLVVEQFGGYWLKPLSNGQIEASWSSEMLNAFMQLGERYPDVAGEIYVVAGKPRQGGVPAYAA